MPEAQLWHFGARDLDPAIGRWTTKDPILFGGGYNLYMYASNDPVNRVDATGRLDIVIVIDIDFVPLVGGAFNGGLVYDTDDGTWSLFSGSGTSLGLAFGAGIGGGICREVEGGGVSADVNLPPPFFLSPTILFDEQGLNGVFLTGGPGAGASAGYGETVSTPLPDVYDRWSGPYAVGPHSGTF